MVGVTLRKGRAADVPAMYRLDCLCFEEPFRFDLRSMRRFASHRNAVVVIAEAEEGIRGFAILEVTPQAKLPLAYLVTLDVHPEHRRAGLARELMGEVERLAALAGVTQIGLHVFAGNEAAILFYERLGYFRVAISHDFYAPGFDAFRYVKCVPAAQ